MFSKTRLILRGVCLSLCENRVVNPRLYSSYDNFPKVNEFKPSINGYETCKNPNEWNYVERLLPETSVPIPSIQETYQTDWKPPTAKIGDHPYYVKRNRSHMLPVFLKITHRGTRHITEIHRIEGDINKMADDLKKIAEKTSGRVVATQVNELAGFIKLKGDHVRIIKNHLMSLGF